MKCLYMTFLLCFVVACKKKEPVTECLPPPDENFDYFGFIIRDSSGKNLLTSTGFDKPDIGKLKVIQPCTPVAGNAEEKDNGILHLKIQVRPFNGVLCNKILLQWSDNDIDTLTYLTIVADGTCGSNYFADTSSLRLNGQKLPIDTTASQQYKAIYTIRK